MEFLPDSLAGCLETVTSTVMSTARQFLPGLAAEEVVLGTCRFHIIKLLGEGGYSFVYLVREAAPDHGGLSEAAEYALKKVLASSQEQLAAARFEIAVMSRFRHPNLLPLLASHVGTADSAHHVAYMLFPLYAGGSVADLVEQLTAAGGSLPASDIIHIFVQVARGLQAMHNLRPQPLLHRDVKPHNVLLRLRSTNGRTARRSGRYQAVLMDFGSVQEGRRDIRSRAEALAMQEDAERHCTAPYRAPELFDVSSECTIDERVDTWSLGCLLYFMMYGVSPFERVLNEAGGSLMLAVINGSLSWPSRDSHPDDLRSLVKFCLNSDPTTRPYIEDVIRFAIGSGADHAGSRHMELSAVQ